MKTILLYLALIAMMYNTTGVERVAVGVVLGGLFCHSMWTVFKGVIKANGGKL